MFKVEREVGNDWEYYSEHKELSDAIFCTEEAFMQDHLNDEFYVYRVLDSDGKVVFKSS
ncbi:hypothetical protein D3C87_1037460 [compost metagenome]